jgi:ribosomal protein S18 acetylase RimI-like enzyme
MLTLIKKLSGALAEGRWFSGRPDVEPLDLDRHFPYVEQLFALEEWPFLRGDLEVSQAQPWATSRVAWKDGRFAGFFATHHFGDVGYLDMMIIAPEFRRAGVARPLYFGTLRALRSRGVRSLVVHTTNESAPMIRLLGFRPGLRFVLLRREAADGGGNPLARVGGALPLERSDRAALLDLDARVFGARREAWIDALFSEPGVRFVGLKRDGALRASLSLRPRRAGTLALDSVNACDPGDLERLVGSLIRAERSPLECFVREGSELHWLLAQNGFEVPEFFRSIGPLVEWRKGPTGDIGLSPEVQSLAWF